MVNPEPDTVSDLTSKMASTSLSKSDKGKRIVIHIQDEDVHQTENDWKIRLACRMCTDVIFPHSTIDKAAHIVWLTAKPFEVHDAGENKYMITFKTRADLLRILDGSPWSFHGFLLVLKEWQPEVEIVDIILDSEAFTVKMYDLKLKHRSIRVAQSIAGGLGSVIFLNTKEKHGESDWIPFEYKRLPHKFCEDCRVLNHGSDGCRQHDDGTINNIISQSLEYLPLLQASNTEVHCKTPNSDSQVSRP
ncbi:protein of unknown function DUF4283 [Macleaya cordata]|uniref:DUF4283 domain-containing protein n=1 Tax=Macleaya cordata TaxID=56857 RepID=A0A200PXY3_MACCD|nr:protein of unknown function DUF4283 [Macleaya cordata]